MLKYRLNEKLVKSSHNSKNSLFIGNYDILLGRFKLLLIGSKLN